MRATGVGGVILFKRNIESPEQVAELCRNLKREAGDRPLLIMVDQEGGRVARLSPPEFTEVPSARRLSPAEDCEAAAAAAGTVRDGRSTLGLLSTAWHSEGFPLRSQ